MIVLLYHFLSSGSCKFCFLLHILMMRNDIDMFFIFLYMIIYLERIVQAFMALEYSPLLLAYNGTYIHESWVGSPDEILNINDYYQIIH